MSLYFLPGPTIPAGQSLSEGVDCTGSSIIRIVMPPAWTSAPLTFQLSPDNVTFYDLFHIQATTGSFVPFEVVVPNVLPGAIYVMPPGAGFMIAFIRFRSGTKGLPVVQAAARPFQIVLNVPSSP
jgi:hypothetical protein